MHIRTSVRWAAPALIASAALGVAGCSSPSSSASSGGSNASAKSSGQAVNVGMIYSKTGLLAVYGAEYRQGFMAGLKYATHGSDSVDGHKISLSWNDDQGDPSTAVSEAKTLIGQGDKILAGTVDSGVAMAVAQQAAQNKVLLISGPAAADSITGVNRYTFRSGRQSYQDVATAATFLGNPSGKKVVVFAQNDTFGQGNLTAVQEVLGAKGAHVSGVLVPESATNFTPFAQQVANAKPDLVFVAWAGDTTAAMWQSLQQQGVFNLAPVTTGLANTATDDAYGPEANKIKFLSYYFPGAAGTSIEKTMISDIQAAGGQADLFSPDGFVGAQMVVHAIEASGGTNVNKMISALEGWSFPSVKGTITIRASDHALLQPMYQAELVKVGDNFQPRLIKTIPATAVAPPPAK